MSLDRVFGILSCIFSILICSLTFLSSFSWGMRLFWFRFFSFSSLLFFKESLFSRGGFRRLSSTVSNIFSGITFFSKSWEGRICFLEKSKLEDLLIWSFPWFFWRQGLTFSEIMVWSVWENLFSEKVGLQFWTWLKRDLERIGQISYAFA